MSTRWTSFTLALALSMPARADDRAVQWRQDLTALAAELKSVHPRFRDCGLTPDFKKRQTALGKRIGRLTDEQVLVEIQRLLASVGDGHTLMLPFGMKKGRLLHIPLMFWSFEEGLYVVDSPDHDLIGKRILRIGGIPAESVLSRLEPYVSHDNGEQVLWAAPFYATLTDFLAAVGATGDRGAAALTFDDGTAATIRAVPIDPALLREKLIAPKTAPAPLYLSRPDVPFWTAELSRDVLYVQVNAMSDGADETLAAFAISLRSRIPRFRAVILDLRLNNGGEATKADELLRTLIASDTQGAAFAVLTSRMTFSAAQTFAARADQWTGALFVGQPTGSKPNHLGNERRFQLPNSGVRVTISSGLNQPVTARDDRMTITPDVLVPMKARDYFAGADPTLEAAIKALASRQP